MTLNSLVIVSYIDGYLRHWWDTNRTTRIEKVSRLSAVDRRTRDEILIGKNGDLDLEGECGGCKQGREVTEFLPL